VPYVPRSVCLDRPIAALPAHRAPQSHRLPHAEPRERHRDLEHLVLEDDDAERLAQRFLEQRVVVLDPVVGVLAQLLAPLDVRMDGAALDRPGPDERDLDRQVVEVLRPRAQEHLHLRAALDLEDADGVGALDLVVDGPVVERDSREVDRLAASSARARRRAAVWSPGRRAISSATRYGLPSVRRASRSSSPNGSPSAFARSRIAPREW